MSEAKTPLWEHQRRALDFALQRSAVGLFLAMGTGKTLVALSLIAKAGHARILVLAPKSVCAVWEKEHRKHLDNNRQVLVLDSGNTKERAGALRRALGEGGALMVVVNYDGFWRMDLWKVISGQAWDLLVLDEAHRLKAPGGVASRAAARIPARSKLALTGTPMPHSPLDIYAVYRTLDRRIFGTSFSLFRARYAVMGGFENHEVLRYQNLEELHEKVYSIAFRVGREVLDLPPEQHVERTIKLSPKARRVYQDLEEDLVALVEEGVVTAANALVRLLRLQQVTSGYVTLDDEGEGGPRNLQEVDRGKAEALEDILEDLPEAEPIVVFARFRRDLDTVHAVAARLRRGSLELSGRRNELSAWQAAEAPPVLAVQIQAGGVGVDFTRAAYCIFFSLGFSLGDYEQALARVHRPGQERPVTYLHLVAEDTIDERVYGALRKKKNVIEEVLSGITKGREDSWTIRSSRGSLSSRRGSAS